MHSYINFIDTLQFKLYLTFSSKSYSSLNLKKNSDLNQFWMWSWKWKLFNSQNGMVRRISMSGAFKLGNLQTFKPNLIQNHTNFFPSILRSQFLSLSHSANIEKREVPPLWENCMGWNNFHSLKIHETEVLQCLGQPKEPVHSPFNQFKLYLNISFESDLKRNISQILIQIWLKS